MPIRVRLTLFFTVLLGATQLIICVGLYLGIQIALERDFDQVLRVRANQVARTLANASDSITELTGAEIQPSDLEANLLDDFAEQGVYIQVLNERGEVLATSGSTLPVDEVLMQASIADLEAFATVTLGSGQRLRTMYSTATVGGQVLAVVEVAETLQFVDDTLADARSLMFGGAALLLVAAMSGGWFLTGRALAPVVSVTLAARHVAETGSFDVRLSPAQPHDELTVLASTFDQMIARMSEVMRRQREFVADTSHELRNPLSVIRGNLDFVRRFTTDQSSLEALHEAELEAARMSRLVDDLLLLAQNEAGQFLALEPMSLGQLIADVAERARVASRGPEIRVSTSVDAWVDGDPLRLHQVVWNLVDNALRYTPPDGFVELSLWTAGSDAVIQVSDTGPGVPAGEESLIFERFYRADVSRDRATGGVGLGLAIVKHITEAHGGRVSAMNRSEGGAVFSVWLTRRLEPRLETATRASAWVTTSEHP